MLTLCGTWKIFKVMEKVIYENIDDLTVKLDVTYDTELVQCSTDRGVQEWHEVIIDSVEIEWDLSDYSIEDNAVINAYVVKNKLDIIDELLT